MRVGCVFLVGWGGAGGVGVVPARALPSGGGLLSVRRPPMTPRCRSARLCSQAVNGCNCTPLRALPAPAAGHHAAAGAPGRSERGPGAAHAARAGPQLPRPQVSCHQGLGGVGWTGLGQGKEKAECEAHMIGAGQGVDAGHRNG